MAILIIIGKKTLKTEYDEINRILDIEENDIYLIASKNGQKGVIKNREKLIDFSYQNISYNEDIKLLEVQRNEKFGALNLKRRKRYASAI